MVPATPFVDGREADLDLPAPFALDLERGELRPFEERLEPDDARGLRVGARFTELRLRADAEVLRLLRPERAELPLRRVLVWAMVAPSLSFSCPPFATTPCRGYERYTPARRVRIGCGLPL